MWLPVPDAMEFPVCGGKVNLDVRTLQLVIDERIKELIRKEIPNLEIDKEVVWPLKQEGKQVYAKKIDFGSLPAAGESKFVEHGIDDVEWIVVDHTHSCVTGNGEVYGIAHPGTDTDWFATASPDAVRMWSEESRPASRLWSLCSTPNRPTRSQPEHQPGLVPGFFRGAGSQKNS